MIEVTLLAYPSHLHWCIEVRHLRSNHNLKAEKVEHANGTFIHTFMQEVTTLSIPVNRHIICGHSHKIGNPNILNVFEIKDTKKLFKSNIAIFHMSMSTGEEMGKGYFQYKGIHRRPAACNGLNISAFKYMISS